MKQRAFSILESVGDRLHALNVRDFGFALRDRTSFGRNIGLRCSIVIDIGHLADQTLVVQKCRSAERSGSKLPLRA
jgi:hypothetical protein